MALWKRPTKSIVCRHCFAEAWLASFEPHPTKKNTLIFKYECDCGSVTKRSYPRGRPGKVTVDDIKRVVRERRWLRLQFGNCVKCGDPLVFMMDSLTGVSRSCGWETTFGINCDCRCGEEIGCDMEWRHVADYFNRLPADEREKTWDEFQALVNDGWP
jgi:hypothetical protein